MKKIVSILLFIILISLTFGIKATDNTQLDEDNQITANVKFESVSTEDAVTIKINLGDFEGISQGIVMSASMSLDYDEMNIKEIEAQGLNDWKVTLSEETKRVLIETDNAMPNTQIAELTFYINENLEIARLSTYNTISIQDFNISDGDFLDETYPEYRINYTTDLPESNEEQKNEEQGNNQDVNEITDEVVDETEENMKITDTDKTMSPDEKLPQTGVNIAIIVIVCVITVLAIIGFIRYKQIEIK